MFDYDDGGNDMASMMNDDAPAAPPSQPPPSSHGGSHNPHLQGFPSGASPFDDAPIHSTGGGGGGGGGHQDRDGSFDFRGNADDFGGGGGGGGGGDFGGGDRSTSVGQAWDESPGFGDPDEAGAYSIDEVLAGNVTEQRDADGFRIEVNRGNGGGGGGGAEGGELARSGLGAGA